MEPTSEGISTLYSNAYNTSFLRSDYHRISHFSALAAKYSPILGFSN
jgi:hypothetical protein